MASGRCRGILPGVNDRDDRAFRRPGTGVPAPRRLRYAALAVANACTRPLFPRPVRIGDLTVFPTTFDRWLAARTIRRRGLDGRLRLWRDLCRPGTVAIDVGANLGVFALAAASAVGPTGAVIAIEPEPELAETVRRAAGHAELEHLRVIEAAALDRSGSVRLESTPGHAGDHRVAISKVRRGPLVRGVRLDDLLSEPALAESPVSAIKIDVQGAEALVLAGMRGLLDRYRNVEVLLEFWPAGLRRFGSDPIELVEAWKELGFEPLLLDDREHRIPADDRFFRVAAGWRHRHVDLLLSRDAARRAKLR